MIHFILIGGREDHSEGSAVTVHEDHGGCPVAFAAVAHEIRFNNK